MCPGADPFARFVRETGAGESPTGADARLRLAKDNNKPDDSPETSCRSEIELVFE
jgi:hypothetical protein